MQFFLRAFLAIILLFSPFTMTAFADCSDNISSVAECLQSGKPNQVITAENYTIDGLKKKVATITNRIILITSLLSIGAIVAAGGFMVLSVGNEDRIKSGKKTLKFGIIGLVVALVSFVGVNIIINFFYAVGG